MLIDTHCHLFMKPLCGDIDGVLKRAAAKGISAIIVPAVETGSWKKVAELSEYPVVYSALGLHPWCADERLDTGMLEKLLIKTGSVAVGEIGLDFKVENPDRITQITVFRTQLDLAAELGLPVILHCRGAFDEMLSILSEKKYNGKVTGVVHAFTRGIQLAERFLELGFFLAFGGAVTRPRAKRARSSAAAIPLRKIVLETDSPSIGMDGIYPERMEPAHVARIGESLALLRGISSDEVTFETSRNARELFNIREGW
ncbi:MAG: TatD family deoxyribonuclease [Candidatus Aegiribacteria sp.]|nr:TatD family deoxyribonuclease [Candidatus Aegiribacteria sp.]